jgi:hypothetical protein
MEASVEPRRDLDRSPRPHGEEHAMEAVESVGGRHAAA